MLQLRASYLVSLCALWLYRHVCSSFCPIMIEWRQGIGEKYHTFTLQMLNIRRSQKNKEEKRHSWRGSSTNWCLCFSWKPSWQWILSSSLVVEQSVSCLGLVCQPVYRAPGLQPFAGHSHNTIGVEDHLITFKGWNLFPGCCYTQDGVGWRWSCQLAVYFLCFS